jgi:hypothetical protein
MQVCNKLRLLTRTGKTTNNKRCTEIVKSLAVYGQVSFFFPAKTVIVTQIISVLT